VGSLFGGRLADRYDRPLRLYGCFEVAVLFIFCVAQGEGVVVWALKSFGFSRGLGIVLRGLMAFVLLFVPVALMGATLPLLAKFVNREAWVQGMRIGALYTLNTFGAVAGCFVTGFFLLAKLGYMRTTLIGALANVIIGVLAIALSMRLEKGGVSEKRSGPDAVEDRTALPRFNVVLLFLAFGVSGFCALGLEVLWTRLLAIIFLGTTYAYTTMLTSLLCGIALGSGAASLLVDRIRGRTAVLGGVMMLTGVGCIFLLGWLAGMPEKFMIMQRDAGFDWANVVRGEFILCFSALFVPAFFFGMTFPLVVKAVGSGRAHLGRDVGRLYSANTFGGVLGALAGGYLLIPALGTHWGMVVLAGLLVLMGAVLLLSCPEARLSWKGLGLAAAMALLVLAWRGAPEDVNLALNVGYIPKDHRVISVREGVEGTVVVSEPEGESGGTNRVLWINRVQATTSIEKGVKMNRLQGVLPLLFDSEPREVLFMCFGSGITCGTLALSEFERIDAVEISPDVLAAAPFFESDNLGVIEREGVQFHIDDGRNFLLTTDNQYDVITFEPMPLALAGVSAFYTREYYELCREHLKPGGMVSQWVPLHSLNPKLVRSLVYTFIQSFSEYSAWFINADLFLIGSNDPLLIDVVRFRERLANPALKAALEKAGLRDVEEVVACFLLDKAGLDAFAEGGELMRDDRPWAEFEAPKLVYARTVPESIRALQAHAAEGLAPYMVGNISEEDLAALERRHDARIHDLVGLERYYGAIMLGDHASNAFKESLEIDPRDYNAQYYLKQIALVQGRMNLEWNEFDEAESLLLGTLEYMPGDVDIEALLDEIRKVRDGAE